MNVLIPSRSYGCMSLNGRYADLGDATVAELACAIAALASADGGAAREGVPRLDGVLVDPSSATIADMVYSVIMHEFLLRVERKRNAGVRLQHWMGIAGAIPAPSECHQLRRKAQRDGTPTPRWGFCINVD